MVIIKAVGDCIVEKTIYYTAIEVTSNM